MAGVAQLVRALGCGSRGHRFDPGRPPHLFKYFSLFNDCAPRSPRDTLCQSRERDDTTKLAKAMGNVFQNDPRKNP